MKNTTSLKSDGSPSPTFPTFLAASALLVTAPALLAAKGGKPGGGDGGGDPPPPPPPPVEEAYTYTASPIPVPPWASLYSVKNLNNAGDAAGNAGLPGKKRGSQQLTEGFVWRDGSHHRLWPVPGCLASEAYDLSDDSTIAVGASWPNGTPLVGDPAAPTAWVFDGGAYHTVDLRPALMAGAAALLPDYDILSFDSEEPYWSNVISSDGRFIRLFAFVGEGAWFYPGWIDAMDVIVELDWSAPLQPQVTGMWPLVSPPVPVPVTPEDNGYFIPVPDTIELGVRSLEDDSPVLRVTSTIWYWDPELGQIDIDSIGYSPAVVWELDLTTPTRTTALRLLEVPPGGLTTEFSGSAVNTLGEVVDPPYLWAADGSLTSIVAEAEVINTRLEGVGPRPTIGSSGYFGYSLTYAGEGPAFHWSAETGIKTDLNTVVAGDLQLNRAFFINEVGQILAAGPGGWVILTPIPEA